MLTRSVVPVTFIALCCAAVLAQPQRAVLEGEVIDYAGAVIPGARVLLINEATLTTETVTTDNVGKFRFELAAPRPYEVRAVANGFRVTSKRILLKAGAQKKLKIKPEAAQNIGY